MPDEVQPLHTPVPLELPAGYDQAKLDDDLDLILARNTRLKINQALMVSGKPPDDPKMLALLLNNVDGIERSALGRKRIKADEKANAANDNMTALATLVLQSMRGKAGNLARDIENVIDVDAKPFKPPVLPEDQEINEFGPGEKNIGVATDNYENFIKRANAGEI